MKIWMIGLCAATGLIPLAQAHAEDENNWRASINAGVTVYAQDEDPQFASLSLAREFEQGFIQLSVSAVRGGVTQGVLNAVPVNSETVSLSGGKSFGDLSVDGYVSLGQRRFDTEVFERLGRRVTINSDGSSFAVGGGLSYDVMLGESVIASPFLAVDYDRIDVGRAVTLPGGEVTTVKSREDGVTGSAGVALQTLFGPDAQHSFGVNAAFVATSNSSATRSGTGSGTISRIVAARNVPGQSDEWAEVGASASFALSQDISLNLNANRTLGFAGPEATSLIAGLSFRF
ncbi:MAG TPA: autotransporter outer membrane beta-barrel domain-containing protein [Sphingorhabdus lacus]|jgi:outer membrane autotransporter protein|nr:autotransporter outer membrane beta-barrel domain-containing protein [Sphingorhabdus lacus]HPV68138.1 autotransporter outer membrane beta-barrel domain-containing protein [Sphingorhabdus lacus]